MKADLSLVVALSPSVILRRLQYWKGDKAEGEFSALGRFGFSDVFKLAWEKEPFSVSLIQTDADNPACIPLEPRWLETVLAAAQIDPKDLKGVTKGEFVCVFLKESVKDIPEMLFISPHKPEMDALLDNPERNKKRAMEAISKLDSIKENAWF